MKAPTDASSAAAVCPVAYVFGPFRLSVRKRRLYRKDQLVPLTPKAVDTLLALVRRAGQIVEKDELLKEVWPTTFVSDETLTQNISTIRKALGDTSDRPEYVATAPRLGYRFVAEVSTLEDRPTGTAIPRRSRPSGIFVGTALVLVFGLAWGLWLFHRTGSAAVIENVWQINPPLGTTLASAGELSPDGRWVAFVAIDNRGLSSLWIQRLGTLESIRLPGTEEARDPFWAPGGQSIGFFARRKLKRFDLGKPTAQTLAQAGTFAHRGGAWGPDNAILFGADDAGPLYLWKGSGEPVPITRLQPGERVHVWPCFLPDGRHFLFRAVAFDPDRSATYIGSLDAREARQQLAGLSSAAIYAPGHLLFVRDGALVSQHFDSRRRRLDGFPSVVASRVAPPDERAGRMFSAAQDAISYVAGGAHTQLAWFDRTGRMQGALDGTVDMSSPALSPDDRFVTGARPKEGVGHQLWLADTRAGSPTRVDTGLPQSGLSVWSPDGNSIVFTSAGDLYRMPAAGGAAELLARAPSVNEPLRIQDWSSDGRRLVFYSPSPATGPDLWWLSLSDRRVTPFLRSTASEVQGQLSPDGRWIAYTSDESGQFEVYVQAFPDGGFKRKISTAGGAQPRWRSDGLELFYLSLDDTLVAVPIMARSPLAFGSGSDLFRIQLSEPPLSQRNHYAVSRDGSRFLINVPLPIQPPMTIRLESQAS